MIRVLEVCIVEYGNRLSEEESPSFLSSRMDRSLKREAVRQFVADSIHRMSDPTQCCRFASFWLEKVSAGPSCSRSSFPTAVCRSPAPTVSRWCILRSFVPSRIQSVPLVKR